MSIVDFILNLAGLLLWLNWRSLRFDPLTKRRPATLMGTLRPAAPKKLRRWHLLVFIAVLLLFRAVIYRYMVPFWVGHLDFGVTNLPFRSDDFYRMSVFSFFSFSLTLGIFYLCLLPLSLLAGPEPFHSLVKVPLGRVDDWPRWAKIILPFFATALFWWLASWVFGWLQISPRAVLPAERFEQSLIIGLGSYLLWKFPLGAILVLHLLNSYVYFGKHPFWKYVHATAQTLLSPLQKIPLRLGKVDFAPVLGLVLIFLTAEGIAYGLWRLYTKLPF
ncbi:MAG TPA: hypothetical protein VK815_08020 [Candidatus Acidoferrales bacterium]|jgi:uncharacterized protein YggT (Ycf19 family)|nr:hypothetical protein [Candidatus Acidoferrales bacterium]